MNKPEARALQIIEMLSKQYPEAKTALHFSNPLEMLVSTILSAQCTDKRVNIVTERLFKRYRTAKDYAKANVRTFEQEIRSTGFFRNKARNITNMAKMLVSEFNGKVPDTMAQLVKLPGVARKTANVVLNNAFHISEGIAVDTHVRRLSRRLGLSGSGDPVKIEQDLMNILPRKYWEKISYYLVDHGRTICKAPRPLCPECVIAELCPSRGSFMRKYYSK
ncbi:MAG: endonuclease III [bacterium]